MKDLTKRSPPPTETCPHCGKLMQLYYFNEWSILLVYPIHFEKKGKLCKKSHDFATQKGKRI
jgi:ssDNA-binding Zn-finger/Zn-ribbon topoisomerase 1